MRHYYTRKPLTITISEQDIDTAITEYLSTKDCRSNTCVAAVSALRQLDIEAAKVGWSVATLFFETNSKSWKVSKPLRVIAKTWDKLAEEGRIGTKVARAELVALCGEYYFDPYPEPGPRNTRSIKNKTPRSGYNRASRVSLHRRMRKLAKTS